jgi:hypothetical protein
MLAPNKPLQLGAKSAKLLLPLRSDAPLRNERLSSSQLRPQLERISVRLRFVFRFEM